MMTDFLNKRISRRTALVIVGVIAVFSAALLLDLRYRGAAWQLFYRLTGEESIAGQVRGMVELGGNLIRPSLKTQPVVPVAHTSQSPYAMNVFLQKEVEEPKIRVMLDMIRDAGFTWLRQEFPWEDIEVDGRGQFTDTRNDINGDGVLDEQDTISSWIKYDRLVDLTEEYGFQLIVRLSNPPDWSRADPNERDEAPPDDFDDFVNFAVAVAERYKGRITHYQIWNEPNIYPEWGENFADPAAYTDMLCRTYNALKEVDPDIVVLSAAIAPTISLDGFFGYQDLVYLQKMYDAGAGECFDILSAQGYGLFSGPTDQRMRVTSVTSARHVFYRDIMVRNGDAHKPVWISEAAWNGVADAELPPEQIQQYDRFGVSTYDENARFMPQYYQRAAEEWAWVGNIAYWFFTRPDPFEADQSFYYFRMVEPDYSPEDPTFTPLPVYDAMQEYIANRPPVLYRGVHQADHWLIETVDGETVTDDAAQFGEAEQTTVIAFQATGTDVSLRVRDIPAGSQLVIDGTFTEPLEETSGWHTITAHESLSPERHAIAIEAPEPFLVDSVTVQNRTWDKVGVPLLIGALLGIFALGVVLHALWRRWQWQRE